MTSGAVQTLLKEQRILPGRRVVLAGTGPLQLVVANQMLDDIGLTERDADGMRLLPDGSVLDIEIGVSPIFANWPDIAQLIVEDWADVGIRAHVEVRERALHFQMRETNDLMTEIWNDDTTGFPFSGQPKQDVRSSPALAIGSLYRLWYQTEGAEGLEPPDDIKRMVEIIDEGKVSGRERQIELAQELFKIWADQVYEIGTVGLTPMVQGVVVAHEADARAREGGNEPEERPAGERDAFDLAVPDGVSVASVAGDEEGVSVEVVDLRTGALLDRATALVRTAGRQQAHRQQHDQDRKVLHLGFSR